MILKIMLPEQILVQEEIQKITVEGQNGYYTLLPKHVDCTVILTAGLISFINKNNTEEFAACDEGVLVKCGKEVLISTRVAFRGDELGTLEQIVESRFKDIDDKERKTRRALARMEADLSRRFFEWSSGRYG